MFRAALLIGVIAAWSAPGYGEAPLAVAPQPPASSPDPAERDFVAKAGTAAAAEIAAGRLAQQHAQDAAVRQFGRWVAADRELMQRLLGDVAAIASLSLPSGMDGPGQDALDALGKLNGSAFDRGYVEGELAQLRAGVALFQAETQAGADQQVKWFADLMLPILRAQLAAAEELTRAPVATAQTPPARHAAPHRRRISAVDRLNQRELNRIRALRQQYPQFSGLQ